MTHGLTETPSGYTDAQVRVIWSATMTTPYRAVVCSRCRAPCCSSSSRFATGARCVPPPRWPSLPSHAHGCNVGVTAGSARLLLRRLPPPALRRTALARRHRRARRSAQAIRSTACTATGACPIRRVPSTLGRTPGVCTLCALCALCALYALCTRTHTTARAARAARAALCTLHSTRALHGLQRSCTSRCVPC